MNQNPFILDEEGEPFTEALLVQFVPTGKVLFPDGRMGPGFFVEAPEAPGPGWEQARLVTAEKAVEGWAAREIRLAPVALRFRWVQGQPGAWATLPQYAAGARGHAQVLGVLRAEGAEPLWAVITAKGLGSRDLIRAFRAHKARVARRFRDLGGQPYAPFAAWMTLRVGEGRRMAAGIVHGLALAEEELVLLPEALGWAIRDRYPEAVRWRAAWGGENGEEASLPIREGEPATALSPVEASPEAPPPPPAHAPAATPEVTPEVTPEGLPPSPASAPEGPGPDAEAALVFLLSQGGEMALARLRRAFPDLPEDPAAAVRELAQRKPRARFWEDISQAVDLFLAWAGLFPRLPQVAPVRLRGLKERLQLGPAYGEDTEDPTVLAALAALRWLFRPGERKSLEALFRDL